MILELKHITLKSSKKFLFLFGRLRMLLFPSSSSQSVQEFLEMKRKSHIILPIAIGLLMPGLRFFSNPEVAFQNTLNDYLFWATASFIIHNLWYVFWFLWDVKKNVSNQKFWFKLILSLMGSIGLILIGGSINLWGLNFTDYKGMVLAVILFIIIQYSLRSQANIAQLQLEKEQILTENYKAQLKVLNAKIDPHFLFNSMNTLRSMVRQSHKNSEKFILSLSDFYRKTLKYNQEITLQLSEELNILEPYLFLMKNRNEKAVFVNIDIDESLYSASLPTLALQIVVENCFKHNSMTATKPLHIDINQTEDGYVEVMNNRQAKIQHEESTGNGLELLIKRYELMNISHGILIEASENQFSVKLKLIP